MTNKTPPSNKLLITLGVSLLGAAAMVGGMQKYRDHSARERVREVLDSGGSLGKIHRLFRSSRPADRARAKRLQKDCDEWFAEVLARNPGLEPDWRPVPDEENGFLQLLDFAESKRVDGSSHDETLALPEDLFALISGNEDWDHDRAAAGLSEHQDLLSEITRLGLLPRQSSAGIAVDRYSFVGARLYKQCCDLLMADARLAAEEGDADRALLRVRATLGIADHLSKIETPSLLMETVSILVRLAVDNQVLPTILPALQPESDTLSDWQAVMAKVRPEPADFAKVLRGEAYVSIRGLAIPLLVENREKLSKHEIPDADAFLDAAAGTLLDHAKQVEGATIGSLSRALSPEPIETPPHLSPGAQEAYEMFYIGAKAWSRGWSRAASIHTRTDAAFAIMAGTEPPAEPITGLAFSYDAENRTLTHPDDPRLKLISTEPVTLPRHPYPASGS